MLKDLRLHSSFARKVIRSSNSRVYQVTLVLGVAIAALYVLCAVAPIPAQLAYLGTLLVIVLGVFLSSRLPRRPEDIEILQDPIALARDDEVFGYYRSIINSLKTISDNRDPILRDLTLHRTAELTTDLSDIANGRLVFVGTETWRMTYARLLRSPGLHLYRSISYVKTSNYWQDQPGRHSMNVNVQMIEKGTLTVERIAVIPDHLWPAGERFPVEPTLRWIDEQYTHGISIKLVRQSVLSKEPDLIVDLGIYGNRAVGAQELDDQGRTVRFTLTFDFVEVLAAEQRWERLSVYATSYRELLEAAGA